MIDEYWTWMFYGYHSDELKPRSRKPIVAKCDDCCKYRILSMSNYRDFCRPCACKLCNRQVAASTTCRICGTQLTIGDNWFPSSAERKDYICKCCISTIRRAQYVANGKHTPFYKNKSCASYLGVHIAERVLTTMFENAVEKMPMNNPGYDFICGNGFKIDVKSACLYNRNNKSGNWQFRISYNTVPDYFLCLAFDNREDLNPRHIWVIPGRDVNHRSGISISTTTVHKWNKYERNIDDVVACCNMLKSDDDE